MVVQDKKIGGNRIHVDLRDLTKAYIHDPFYNHFTGEFLKNVGGREDYSSMDGF